MGKPQDIPTKVGLPAHEIVYRKIRDKLLFGDLGPGQAVTINGLVDEIGMSMTPVREGLRRLIAEGALDFMGNRRVCVPEMTRQRFDDLVFARQALEPRLAELAANNITPEHIDLLAKIDAAVDRSIVSGDVPEYMRQNHKFHFTLYDLADAPILRPMVDSLWLQYGPLYRMICGKWGTDNLTDQHAETIEALKRRDSQGVVSAISGDIEQGFEIVRSAFDW